MTDRATDRGFESVNPGAGAESAWRFRFGSGGGSRALVYSGPVDQDPGPQTPWERFTKPVVLGIVLTVVWLLAAFAYIQAQYGWGVLGELLPHELGIVIAGIVAPLIFLWLLVAFVERGRDLRDGTGELNRQIRLLTYPT